ncbi:uncharacterized protein L201_008133 [Kwoniella dendrophila CBS 6074]|uniref:Capsular associated protein n=1 Tax=Kwoniella dendrophila CBS 6074 TaxID=1295534 RepID=A0AAX4K8J9_9TREE
MFTLPASRRPHIFLAILAVIALTLFIHTTYHPQLPSFESTYSGVDKTTQKTYEGLEADDLGVRGRVERMRSYCEREDPFEKEYGRTNIRMTRAYEGSHHRIRQFLHKALRGEHLTASVIGGSITKGHQVWVNEIWFHKFWEWLNEFVGEDVGVTQVNGAAPATGSDYFSFCFPLHIPTDSDIVFVELAVNDEGIPEHVENMENLLRGLLELPSKPAVVLVEAMAFSNGGMGGGGGRMHLPVAQYFDVPVINQRHPIASHFGRYPQLVRPYFSQDWWGNPDMRHINARGHYDLGMLAASLIQDVSCAMFAEPDFHVPTKPIEDDEYNALLTILGNNEDENPITAEEAASHDEARALMQVAWPEQSKSWRKSVPEGEEGVGELMPGMWNTPAELGIVPRMRVLDGWNPDTSSVVPLFKPICLSTRATEAKFNLTPSYNDGEWEYWVHPEHLDKPYWVARKPGAVVSFELSTNVGIVKMYRLQSKTFGLGTVECWANEDKHKSVKIAGWWDNGDANIGRFATIRTDLPKGRHTITCELLEETSDPEGGHEFRLISMMR